MADHRRAVRGLEDLVDAMEAVDWSNVPEIGTSEVAAFSERLSASMACLKAELSYMEHEGSQ